MADILETHESRSGGSMKRPWVPPKFVQEALGHLPLVEDGQHPQKRFYRSRAHCNPLSHNDACEYPPHPGKMNWSVLYPGLTDPVVRFLDVGCGFGGLTVALSALFPDKIILALEIRAKVCEFEGGILYAITDVEELHQWHVAKLSEHLSFERVPEETLAGDVTVTAITRETEESKKVERAGGRKYWCVFRRRPDAVVINASRRRWPVWSSDEEKHEEE